MTAKNRRPFNSSLCTNNMDEMNTLFWRAFEEASAARAHFHTWWALRNLALPEHYETMNKSEYVDFFHVANAGNFKLMFISLSKIFDRDTRVASISNLKQTLVKMGRYPFYVKMGRYPF